VRTFALLLLLTACTRAPPPPEPPCATCHATQAAAVAGSHHARGQAHADGGALFTIGFEPLSQIAVRTEDGRLQIAPLGYVDGGVIELTNAIDWREPAFNWNGSCAPCHATGFVVGAGEGGAPRSTWRAINVDCEACHGDAKGHRAWLASGKPASPAHGFARSLSNTRNDFRFPDDGGAIARPSSLKEDLEVDTCGGCHSRRRALTDDGALTGPLLDRFEPALREPGLYANDGAAVEEVFELGSFLMSPMSAAGVHCTNCHEPHGGGLRAQGDALCGQCHRLEAFAPHAKQQPCASCHMPARTFLAVNERRDHFLHGAAPKDSVFTRASALARSQDVELLEKNVTSPDGWLRYGVATALRGLPPRARMLGAPLLKDPLRAVRVRAARALVGVTPVPPAVLAELETAERANGFRGEAWLNLGMTAWALGDRALAEAHFRHGLEVEPRFAPLIINLADLLRETQRDAEGRALLEAAMQHPGGWKTSLAYALGLARWRANDHGGALDAFRIAKEDGDPLHVRAFELAVADGGAR
jgi:predicted CXXCH cytochrome family protein